MSRSSRSPDVVVVGGGIIGTSAASFLAEAGLRVILVERTAVAAGASGRNSGAVQDPFDPLLTSFHGETLEIYRGLGQGGSGFVLPTRPAGLLLVSLDEAPVAAIWRDVRDQRPDLEPTLLNGADLRAIEPAIARGVIACRLNTGYPVPPAAATIAFARRAEAAGAHFRIGAGATLTRRNGHVAGVEIEGERILAAAVLVAAGALTAELIDPAGSWRPIHATWGVNVEVELRRPPQAVVEEVGVETVAASVVDESSEPTPSIFSLVTAGGSSSLGSTFLRRQPDADAVAPVLRERGAGFMPVLRDQPIRSVRTCARPQSIDGRPLLGEVPGLERLFVASGHGPWGISVGPACARIVSERILGRPVIIPPELSADRFGEVH